MTLLLLALLAAAWAWWGYVTWRGRREGGNTSSISSFSNQLSVLERTSPDRLGFATVDTRAANQRHDAAQIPSVGLSGASTGGTLTLSEARRRRRMALMGLSTALLVSLMMAGVVGGIFLWMVALTAVSLAGYGGLLAWTRQVQAERQQKVRYLDQTDQDWAHEGAYEDAGDPWWEHDGLMDHTERPVYASSGS